tara:strand:+ start:83 stop:214 length:132 start_codon:yes stop_codon:yes gene_type:complete
MKKFVTVKPIICIILSPGQSGTDVVAGTIIAGRIIALSEITVS